MSGRTRSEAEPSPLLGIDIGGSKCAVILGVLEPPAEAEGGVGPAGGTGEAPGDLRILAREAFPTEPRRGPEETLERLLAAADALPERGGRRVGEVAAVGISCGGPLDSRRGLILSPPNLPGWDAVPVVELVQRRYGVETRLENDANACALAEWRFGAGRGFRSLVFLTFGTGMGAGLILNGRLYRGANDTAGEVGHVRLSEFGPAGYGKAGSFEGFCSGGGLEQLGRTKVLERWQRGEAVGFCRGAAQLEGLDARRLAEAAEGGDALAREVFALCGQYLGKGLALLVDILNPEAIILGSIFARTRELLWPAALAALQREALPRSLQACRVLPAGLGEQIGDYAALTVAAYRD
jgi:glucokinase